MYRHIMTQGIFIFSADLVKLVCSPMTLFAAEKNDIAIQKRRRLQIGRDMEMHNLRSFNSTDTEWHIEPNQPIGTPLQHLPSLAVAANALGFQMWHCDFQILLESCNWVDHPSNIWRIVPNIIGSKWIDLKKDRGRSWVFFNTIYYICYIC